jgi:uncharacterized protein (DUF302 family)
MPAFVEIKEVQGEGIDEFISRLASEAKKNGCVTFGTFHGVRLTTTSSSDTQYLLGWYFGYQYCRMIQGSV